MVTEYDKTIAAAIVPVIVWLNQWKGWALPADPNVIGSFVAILTGIIVYVVPNKKPA